MSAVPDSPDAAAPPPSPILPVRPAPLPGAPAPHVPEEPTVTVTFALEPRDLDAFQNYALKRGGETWRLFFFLAALVVTANAIPQLIRQLVDRPAPQFDITDALLTYALPVTVLFSSYFSFLTQQPRKRHDQSGRYEPRTIGLSQTYLHSADKQGDGRVRWNAVKTVDRGKQYTFITLTNNTGHVIPDRAFADDAQAFAFYEQAVAYWRAATSTV